MVAAVVSGGHQSTPLTKTPPPSELRPTISCWEEDDVIAHEGHRHLRARPTVRDVIESPETQETFWRGGVTRYLPYGGRQVLAIRTGSPYDGLLVQDYIQALRSVDCKSRLRLGTPSLLTIRITDLAAPDECSKYSAFG